ncbi:MAG: biotin/lipoyl-containing protein [Rubrobacteraceae bacterium]
MIRKQALEQANAPDDLDRLMHVTSPKMWLALIALGAIVLAALAWGLLGRIPVEVTAQAGILLKRDSVNEVAAQETGVVSRVAVREGDEISEGQTVAFLEVDGQNPVAIKSFFEGTATDVLVERGMVVDRGEQVAVIERGNEPLQAVMYVPIDDGKRLKKGTNAFISPSTVPSEEYGYMLGTVSRVSEFPPSEAEMMLLLQNQELVKSLRGDGDQLEVVVDLTRDPSTPSGFEWSIDQGPPFDVSNVTLATGTFVLGKERPAELVLPSER